MIVATFCVKLGGKQQYQTPLVINIPLPSIVLLSIMFLPESPRWLLLRRQDEKATRSLQRFRPSSEPATCIKDEVLEMKAVIYEEMRQARGSAHRDIIKNPVDRRRATLSIVIELTERATGATWQNSTSRYYLLS